MENISLKFWQNAGKLKAYASFLDEWFAWLESVIEVPINQLDAENVSYFILNLMAYEKGIEQFDGEPESLYRKRVKFADINMKDAGTKAGLLKIWERLELGYLEVNQRIDGRDWDIIELLVTDDQLSKYSNLIDIVVKNYGLTCRRYEVTTLTENVLGIHSQFFEGDTENAAASIEALPVVTYPIVLETFQFSGFEAEPVFEPVVLETFEYSDF